MVIKPAKSSAEVAENSWVSKAPMHEARSGVGIAVVNDKIYAIGGIGKNGFIATNEEYDPATNTWIFREPMPTPRSAFGIAVYQDKIYCFGGYIVGGPTGVNEVYNPATDTWETKTPMPTARLNLRANVVNGKIYLISGYSSDSKETLNEVYDPTNDTWITKASIPNAVDSYGSAVVDNRIFVITSKLTQIYDAENDSWSLGAPAPLPSVSASAGATTGVFAPERIYVFGADADMPYWQLSLRKFTTQSYDPKTNSWTICASMPTGRFDAGVAVVNDKLYLIGGFTIEFPTDRFTLNPSYTYSTANQEYTPFGYGTAPKVAVVSPENKTYAANNVSLAFTVNKPAVWFGYSLDGQETVTITGNASLTGLSSGLHNITVYAKDTFENIGASETIIFSIEEPFPTAIIATVSGASVALIGIGLVVYFKKRKH
jgi:N-acetylneuraminic acid mutarotase